MMIPRSIPFFSCIVLIFTGSVVYATANSAGPAPQSDRITQVSVARDPNQSSADAMTFAMTNDPPVLAGLEGMNLFVETVSRELTRYDVNDMALQTEMEMRLRQNGITVFTTEEQWLPSPGTPTLYVQIDGKIEPRRALAALTITVQLRQSVLLSRNPNLLVGDAITWQTQMITFLEVSQLRNVREPVKTCVENFCKAYTKANTKQGPAEEKKEQAPIIYIPSILRN